MKAFTLKFTLISISAVIDDANSLTIKQGLKTWKTEVSRLRHLFVMTHPDVGYELMLSYDDDSGKLKKIRLNSNFGQPEFEGLVNELVTLRPDIDIRTKPVAEAHKLMGAVNVVRIAPVIVFFTVMAVMTGLFLPNIIHGIDSGEQTVSITDIAKLDASKSRNLTVTDAYLYIESYLEETTKDESSKTVKNYIAMVPESFQEGDPINMIMETDTPESILQDLASESSFKGVLRNVLWEGLTGDQKEFFKKDLNLNIADTVMLLHHGADKQFDLMVSLIILGASAVIMLIVSIIVAKRMPKIGVLNRIGLVLKA